MMGISRHVMKWYSRNSCRLWYFKAAQEKAVEVCVSSVDTAVLHGLTRSAQPQLCPRVPLSGGVFVWFVWVWPRSETTI